MKTTEVISAVQNLLDIRLDDAQVLVAGAESRPVPSVVIEDWDVSHIQQSMTNYLSSLYDEQGKETARVYRIPYKLRVDFMAKHKNTVEGSRLYDDLKHELFRMASTPRILPSGVSQVELNGGGGVSHQFVNPTESEYTQTATFTAAQTYHDSSLSNIENIEFEREIIQ